MMNYIFIAAILPRTGPFVIKTGNFNFCSVDILSLFLWIPRNAKVSSTTEKSKRKYKSFADINESN